MERAFTGKDGWPLFPSQMSPADVAAKEDLERKFKTLKKTLNNTGSSAQNRASKEATKDTMAKQYAKAAEEKEEILQQAHALFFKVTTAGGGSASSNSDDAQPLTKGDMRQMLQQYNQCQMLQIQQFQQQPLMSLQNGGVGDQLTELRNDLRRMSKVKELAAQKLVDDEDADVLDLAAEKYTKRYGNRVEEKAVTEFMVHNESMIRDIAVKRFIDEHGEKTILKMAAKRIKLDKNEESDDEEEKEEEEEEEEETSSDDE